MSNTIKRFNINDCKIVYSDATDRKGFCTTHGRRMFKCEKERADQQMMIDFVYELTEYFIENRNHLTPEFRRQIEQSMAVERCEYDFNEENRMWCFTHKEPADHCAPNGDDRCCRTYALSEGCSCCEDNRV